MSERLRRYGLIAALLILALLALSHLQGGSTVPAGTQVGDLKAELSDGRVITLSEFQGEVLVLNFWATWCGPCKKEAPILSRLHRDGVRVVGLAVDQTPLEKLAAKGAEIGIDYPVGKGSQGMMGRLAVRVVPTTYVIGPDGAVAMARTGMVSLEELEQAIADARARPRPAG